MSNRPVVSEASLFEYSFYLKLIIGFTLGVCYALTRLTNLTILPIFSDEAIYIRWAQIITDDPTELFIPLVDGKQPFFMWLNALTLKLFNDPLISARIISVAAGGFTILGIFLIGRLLYSTFVGLLAASMYIFLPFALFYERMALTDSLLNMFSVYVLLFSLLFYENKLPKTICSVGLGLLMGCAFLTKSSALLFIILPCILAFLYPSFRLGYVWLYLCLSYIICFLLILPIFISKQAPIFEEGSKVFHKTVYFVGLWDMLSHPFNLWIGNLAAGIYFFINLLTLPIVVVVIFSCLTWFFNRDKRILALIIWSFFPVISIILIARGFFSRYLFLCVPLLAIMAAKCLTDFKEFAAMAWSKLAGIEYQKHVSMVVFGISVVFLMSPPFFLDIKLLRNPVSATLNELDYELYISGENSGYGIMEIVEYLKKSASGGQKHVVLLVPAKMGNPDEGVSVYLNKIPNIDIYVAWRWPQAPLLSDELELKIVKSKYNRGEVGKYKIMPEDEVYFIYPFTTLPKEKFLEQNPRFRLVYSLQKPGGKCSVDLYKLADD